MDGKPKISADDTFDFDCSDPDRWDDLSPSGVTESVDIDALLDAADQEPTVEANQLDDFVDTIASEQPEVLLAHEVLFGSGSDD